MKIGYGRPTLLDPTLPEQFEKLRAAGAERHIWHDESRKEWTQRDYAVKACREGDELLVLELHQLGQDEKDLIDAIKGVLRRGAVVRLVNADTVITAEGLAMLAELELAKAAYRKMQILPAQRAERKKRQGRPPELSEEKVKQAVEWQDAEDLSYRQLVDRFFAQYGEVVKLGTLHKRMREWREAHPHYRDT